MAKRALATASEPTSRTTPASSTALTRPPATLALAA
eukprot:CAMPEP_0185158994 /NCGR_PEP_ID=MMETSP1139-20130426/2769_1 /TAXON_ID=298111 /ORGANISM="Pavlova sp., Strain CCMP459" /LENGTH=35 /DNA_ID= /DNA_START= /DNA_END= /DNA_ORIENTATION=